MPQEPQKKPMPGRCTFQKKDGAFCQRYPLKGSARCRVHGGGGTLFWERLRRLDATARGEVHAALKDPDLMDVRRPLALGEVVLTRAPLIPSDDAVEKLARRRVAMQLGGDLKFALKEIAEIAKRTADTDVQNAAATVLFEAINEIMEPSEADYDDVRMDMHVRSMKMISIFSQRQAEAVKALEWTKVIREQALPFLAELGLRLSTIVKARLPDEQQDAVMEDIRKAIIATIAQFATARDG